MMHDGDTLNYTMVVIHFHEFCTKLYSCEATNYISKQGEQSDDDEFQDLTKENFEILSKIKNRLGSEIKFESSDFIQMKRYLNSRQGFDLNDFLNSKRFKHF
jgi:hypothetical protein